MVVRWERGMDGGIAPIDEDLDEDLGALRLAEELRVPPWELPRVPRQWINAALIRLEVKGLQAEERAKQERTAQRKQARHRR